MVCPILELRSCNLRLTNLFLLAEKFQESLKIKERKPSIIDQQHVVYKKFKCDSCNESYIGFTYRHLHKWIEEHKGAASSIGKHYRIAHDITPLNIDKNFTILWKCKSRFDCLLVEMLLIREQQPTLNKQSDSLRAKIFV